ncbi:hypothetical protein Tco_0820230 [Tanacetum coccineum]|uniref:Uncharacterized protein n=1 Tax=Tanacetum coccineum TaxID=301880 RepID=A0ABQ5A8W0_9ASTR
MDLFTFDIQGIKTYEGYELNNNMTGDLEEPWSDNGEPYQLYIDGFVMEENYRGLVRVKLEECWWKVNAYEVVPFTRWKNYGQEPYANAKTKKAYDPYLDINRIFGRNYGADNAVILKTIRNMRWEYHDPSTVVIRRFER